MQEFHTGESLILKLKQENEIMRSFLNSIPMQIYFKDKSCNFITGTKYSKAFVENGIDQYCDNIKIDLDSTKAVIEREDKYVMETGKVLIQEKEVSSPEGVPHWYKIYRAPVINDAKEVQGVLTMAQNVDAEKLLENRKELFLATLTHDLKNPIQAQIKSLKMLAAERFGSLNKSQTEILNMTIESAMFVQDMLYSILTTYKYDNGIIVLDKKDVNIVELVQNCINEITAGAYEKNINVIFTHCEELHKIKLIADVNQLRRVVSNILNNSIKYAFKGTNIKISIEQNNEHVVFNFENSSPPIPENVQKHMFDKYVTGEENYKNIGIGLGLYLSRKIIEAHNGKIYLTSNLTENIFTFELPVALDNDSVSAHVVW